MKKMISVFKNRNYARLFFAHFTSQMGSTIGLTAFMFYLLDRFTDQPTYATVTELMYSLPTLAVFFLVGVVADRFDRQKVAMYSDWICGFLSVLIIGAIIIDIIPIVFALLFIRSAVQKFFYPAESSIVQGILSKDEYTTAAGLNQLVMSLFMLFGNALGIFFYWTLGIHGAILIDAATFIISGILIKSCVLEESTILPNGRTKWKEVNIAFVLKDFKNGLSYILNNKLLLTLLSGFVLFGIVNGGFSVMPVFMLKYKLQPNNYEEYSIIMGIVIGAGVMIGSVIASMLAQKIKLYKLLILGLALSGFFTAISSMASNTIIFFALFFIGGLFLPLVNVSIGGWMPSIVDPKMMGRVQGWISPLMMLAQSITLGFIAFAYPTIIKVEGLYWMVGGCLMIVSMIYLISIPRILKKDETKAVPVKSVQETAL
ncbi:MFS transporter [Peribacillus alkalitolerans]|uniref:MFS transporter n=1 Tax=Peribacillus alkalitolerans TaxID=1550385 RepID=UPI0013D70C20|nr:MFS transporter [Peribacillus alkalitolerans]